MKTADWIKAIICAFQRRNKSNNFSLRRRFLVWYNNTGNNILLTYDQIQNVRLLHWEVWPRDTSLSNSVMREAHCQLSSLCACSSTLYTLRGLSDLKSWFPSISLNLARSNPKPLNRSGNLKNHCRYLWHYDLHLKAHRKKVFSANYKKEGKACHCTVNTIEVLLDDRRSRRNMTPYPVRALSPELGHSASPTL